MFILCLNTSNVKKSGFLQWICFRVLDSNVPIIRPPQHAAQMHKSIAPVHAPYNLKNKKAELIAVLKVKKQL